MRVRFTKDHTAWLADQYRVHAFSKGDEYAGLFAQQLVDMQCPVEVVDEDPDVPPADDAVPDGTAKDVLDWVGDDKERAAMALDLEQAKGDNARSTLVASLTKLAG